MSPSPYARRPSHPAAASRGRGGSGATGRMGNRDASHGSAASASPQKQSASSVGSGSPATRISALVDMLVGQMVVVVRSSGERLVGVLSSGTPGKHGLSLVLSAAQTLTADESGQVTLGPLIPRVTLSGSDVCEIDASNVRLGTAQELAACVPRASSSSFRTDTEISRAGGVEGGRALQRWEDDSAPPVVSGALEDTTSGPWDQFAANEAQFGVRSNYEESMYTTKLDKSGHDFKQREREAERLAKEILTQGSSNAHVAEERGLADDSGLNEEDKYGAVVRGPEAHEQQPAPPKDKPRPDARDKSGAPPKALTAEFREFVSAERERLVVRKAELAKKEKQNRLADLRAWAQSFKLKTPPPRDVERRTDARPSNKNAAPAEKQPEKSSAAPEKKPGGSKLNVHASSFNPGAAVFRPGVKPAAKPAPKPSTPAHPFFGHRELKNRPSAVPVRVRDDFKVWKMKKVPEASAVAPLWPYTGRPFRQHFVAMAGMPVVPVFGDPGPLPPIVGVYPDAAISPRPVPPQAASPSLAPMVYQPYAQYSFGQPPFVSAQPPVPVPAQGSPMPYNMSPQMVPFTQMARLPNGAGFAPMDYGNQPRRRGKGERTDSRDSK